MTIGRDGGESVFMSHIELAVESYLESFRLSNAKRKTYLYIVDVLFVLASDMYLSRNDDDNEGEIGEVGEGRLEDRKTTAK
jgi:hypothetical protein